MKRARELAKTPGDRREVARLAREVEWARICEDPLYFIEEHCFTLDEHDALEPYKRVPRKAYIHEAMRVWQEESRLLIPKSRQVMISWMMVLCHLWLGMTKRGQLIFFQSKKEEDADKLVDRAWGVYQRLPEWMRKRVPAVHSKCNLKFPGNDSRIQGIPEGMDQIRSNTASAIFSDESAFQPEFGSAFAAAQPAVEGGGRFTAASSSKVGEFWDLTESEVVPGSYDQLLPGWEGERPKWLDARGGGMSRWRTKMDWAVLDIHYSADPDKDLAWAKSASRKYRGGPEGSDWQAEMEKNPMARAGARVFPEFSRATNVIPSFTIPDEWPRFRGIDPGYNNPCAVVWVAQDGDGTFFIYDVYYERGKTVAEVASVMKGRTGRVRFQFTKIGHDANAQTQAGKGKTLVEQFSDEGIFPEVSYVKTQDAVTVMADLIQQQENGEPRLKVMDTANCQPLIRELERYRYPELTEQQKLSQAEKEIPIKKDDHAIDALKHVLCAVGDDYLHVHGIVDPLEDVKVRTISQRARSRVFVGKGGDSGQDIYWDRSW